MSFLNAVELEARSIREAVVDSLPYAHGRVLDVGCGTKPYQHLFRGHYTEYIGIDFETVQKSKADVFANSLHLPFRSNALDTVFSTQVIEHIPDPFLMMREMARVVRPLGHVIITAPQVWPIHEAPYDFFRYTNYGLEHLATQAGLNVVLMRERHGGVYALGQMACFMLYSRHHHSPVMRFLLKPIFLLTQLLAALVDRLYYYPEFTLGYVLVAQKAK